MRSVLKGAGIRNRNKEKLGVAAMFCMCMQGRLCVVYVTKYRTIYALCGNAYGTNIRVFMFVCSCQKVLTR